MESVVTKAVAQDSVLVDDIRKLIDQSRERVALTVNAELSLLYWNIGRRIGLHALQGERGEYGKQIINNLSKQLTRDFGGGWSPRHLRDCVRVAEVFNDQIWHTLCAKLSWSHLRVIVGIDDTVKRDFYIELMRGAFPLL